MSQCVCGLPCDDRTIYLYVGLKVVGNCCKPKFSKRINPLWIEEYTRDVEQWPSVDWLGNTIDTLDEL